MRNLRNVRNLKMAMLLGVGLVAATSLLSERSAEACGGCFGPPGPGTQVTAHRMAFAVTPKRTILWDQIQYVGSPESFGWVLPIRSGVDVGVSSDELFNRLESTTQPNIRQPEPPACPPPEKRCRTYCGGMDDGSFGGTTADASAAAPGVSADTGVTVWDSGVVGPYEATQLSATDGTALRTWLKDHGYTLPLEIGPVVDQYIKEGFGFLAIKLVPTAGTSKMVPIRIAFDGASPELPLRMVAAGTGTNVGIKLWVLGEGRWEAKNFPTGEVANADLVWDWRAMASNFNTLENSLITANPDGVWIAETSDEWTKDTFFSGLPKGTTTTDAGTVFSSDTDQSEIDRAFPARASISVTRLFAQLPQSALGKDLELQASLGGKIPATRTPPKSINYACPAVEEVFCPGVSPTCDGTGTGTNPGAPGSTPWGLGGGAGKSGGGGGGGCSTNSQSSGGGSSLPWLGVGLLGLLAASATRRRWIGR